MWRRLSVSLKSIAAATSRRSALLLPSPPPSFLTRRSDGGLLRLVSASSSSFSSLGSVPSPSSGGIPPFLANQTTSAVENVLSKEKKPVKDIMPIATGHEREELVAELEGKKRFDMDAPTGPFGTKDAPAIVQSYYSKRLVGCPGGEKEDEHDVVWFWLEKDKPMECPVCSQYFELEVIGEGGPPDGHGDDDH
ncbi:cytochrome c oxidase subunit 5b-2, mitochondrial-like [Nymphaea colorata]|nr:cytochrome c oxidase subunit 5b-2, mitochondrial-like [Nymphaea colorata]